MMLSTRTNSIVFLLGLNHGNLGTALYLFVPSFQPFWIKFGGLLFSKKNYGRTACSCSVCGCLNVCSSSWEASKITELWIFGHMCLHVLSCDYLRVVLLILSAEKYLSRQRVLHARWGQRWGLRLTGSVRRLRTQLEPNSLHKSSECVGCSFVFLFFFFHLITYTNYVFRYQFIDSGQQKSP